MAIDEPGLVTTDANPRICTVTFGRSSFIGKSLISMLLKSKNWIVRIADPLPPRDDKVETDSFFADSIRSGRASYFQVDFRDKSQILRAIDGSSVVFHMDPTVSSPPVRDFFHLYTLTVQSTKNVIRACQECRVERLVYTGSADVVFDGVNSIQSGDESLPYPRKFQDMLNDLRAQAEAVVLMTNGSDGLSTCALRPSNPFGPGDPHLMPLLVGGAKSCWAKFIIGSGENMCDFTYVENVAHANICAEQALRTDIASVTGKPLFITNLEPVKLWVFISNILEGLGYQRPRTHLPMKLVLFAAGIVEQLREKFGLYRNANHHLTPAIIQGLSCTRTFDCSKAQRLIGYSPIISLEDGVTLTVESFSHLAKVSPYPRRLDIIRPSKTDKLLGSGRVADLLLWRDEKKTFTYLIALFLLFYWFLLTGRTFISSTAKLLLLLSVIIFGHGILPSSMFGFTIEKMSSSYFEISESDVRHAFTTLVSIWNRGICGFKSLAKGDDWNVFLKAAGSLYLLKLLMQFSVSVLVGVGLVCLFTFFIVYEQYEEEIEKVMRTAAVGIKKSKETVVTKLPNSLAMYVHKS